MKTYPIDRKRIADALQSARRPKIAVVGDFCLDKYLYIDAALDEPSVETGQTAYQVRRRALYPGAGGTIANNLASLGARVAVIGLYGDDGEGYELIRALKKIGVETDGMICGEEIFTSTYTKPMREIDGVWTELNRLDIRNSRPASGELIRRVIESLLKIVPDCDAVIVSDQFTYEAGSVLCSRLRETLTTLSEVYSKIFFLVDSRSFSECYREMMVKCNAGEILAAYRRMTEPDRAARVEVDEKADQKIERILEAGKALWEQNQRPVLVTRGASGSILFNGGEPIAIPPFRVRGPIDICGAGDATNAALAFGRALGLDLADAAHLAAVVSSITIQQIGVTGTATVEQVLKRVAKS